jgi:hypothetical protein
MKKGYTHIVVVLDSSGSMGSIINDTIEGFNHFLKSQKEAEGEATMTLVEFAHPQIHNAHWGRSTWNPQDMIGGVLNDGKRSVDPEVNVKYDFQDIKNVSELNKKNYVPSGGTPLLDTIAATMNRTGKALAALPETLRPEKVLMVIITDGEENASVVYNHQKVMEMIQHQTIVYKWEFMYLGANQDAIQAGAAFGMSAARSMSYGTSKDAIGSTYGVLASKTMAFRSAASAADATASLNFTMEERTKVQDKK